VSAVPAGVVRRRAAAEGVRDRQIVVRFSVGEFADVAAAAAAAGLAFGGWVGDVAVRTARADRDDLRVLLGDVIRVRAGADPRLAERIDALVDVLVERLS
jgi:hypothetical protein